MRKQLIVVAAALVAVGAFGLGAYLYNSKQAQQTGRLTAEDNPAFNRPDSPSLGPLAAKVQVMEFFDPACESCRMFHPHVKTMLTASAGKVRLTLRYATFHEGSEYVATLLEAARMQGQDVFWKVLEAVLGAQPIWADHGRPQTQLVWSFLGGTGLDMERARRDMEDPRIAELLARDAADLSTLKVTQTPTFFINGKPLDNYAPNGLSAQVQREIAAAYRQ